MKVKYFADTDTALIEFTGKEIIETREISENIYVDFDADGNMVSMTVEHAKANAGLWEFSYQEMMPPVTAQAACRILRKMMCFSASAFIRDSVLDTVQARLLQLERKAAA